MHGKETLGKFVPFPQKSQYSADTRWKRDSVTKDNHLINGTVGDCMLLDPNSQKPAVNVHYLIWKKGSFLGKMKGPNVTPCKTDNKRCIIASNGSLSLCPAWLEDSGQYVVEAYTKDGIQEYTHRFQVVLAQPKLRSNLINGTPGNCVLFDLDSRKPAIRISNVTWRKDHILMGKMKGGNVTACEIYSKRCLIFINGSLSLCPMWLEDSGQYFVEVFTDDGKQLYNQSIHLVLTDIEGPAQHELYTAAEGQWPMIRNEEETTAAAAPCITKNPTSLNISTFQGEATGEEWGETIMRNGMECHILLEGAICSEPQ
ncbi:uncharacterized protein LOC110088694 isoform X1 [Pogona vitticeps]